MFTTSGSGIKKTQRFTTGDDWTTHYTYDCAQFGYPGNFQIYVDDNDIAANQLGKGGSDSTEQYGSSGTHYLEVNSTCNWTIKVTGALG